MTLERGEACKRIENLCRTGIKSTKQTIKTTKTIMQVCSISMYKSLANHCGNYST